MRGVPQSSSPSAPAAAKPRPAKVRATARTRSRGRPTSEDVAEIENDLLNAALAEFMREGYGGASMRSIAKAANIARTTLQARYDSKESLFKAIITQQIQKMSASAMLTPKNAPDLRTGLKAYANRALSYSLEGEFLNVNRLINSASSQFPEVVRAAFESTQTGIKQITAYIKRCSDAEGITCQNPELPAECFILLIRGWYGQAFLREAPVTSQEREQWVDSMVELLVAGRAAW